jgi:Holliday junction resolvase RusA-like endonuclease
MKNDATEIKPGQLLASGLIYSLPPSVNSVWRYANGTVHKPEKAKAWQTEFAIGLKNRRQYAGTPYEGDACYLLLIFSRARGNRDIDNMIKCAQDALAEGHVIENDKQVQEFRVRRIFGEQNATEMFVWAGARLPEKECRRIMEGWEPANGKTG